LPSRCSPVTGSQFGHAGWQLSLDGREQAAPEPLALPVRNDGEPAYLRDGRCARAHTYTDGGHEAASLVSPTGGGHFISSTPDPVVVGVSAGGVRAAVAAGRDRIVIGLGVALGGHQRCGDW